MEKVKVGISCGDMNGIGLETVIKVFCDTRMLEHIVPVIYSHAEIIKQTKRIGGMEEFTYQNASTAEDAVAKKVNLVNCWKEFKGDIEWGKPTELGGEMARRSLEMAASDLASNKIDVLVTAPFNKDNVQNADFNFPGHTEYLAKMAGTEKVLMFLVSPALKIGIVTGHVPLKEVSANITKEKITEKLAIMRESLERDFGIPTPRIAVLGLNPHAGDNGLIGTEEKEVILPVVREQVEKGFHVYGPFGADGFFGSGAYLKFDAVLAMYHDQGLAPFKAIAFDSGVNFTAGLPIVRTSPDHGVAYDLAGQGTADEASLRAAIFTATDVFLKRKEYRSFAANPLQMQDIKENREDRRE
jgi:4-hydroxythreonine-4-phosphate dehydrogenase